MYRNKKLDREAAVAAEIVKEANEAIANGQINIGMQLKRKAKDYLAALEAA
jgi:hypothetical protein